jgi:hypothetical protein
MQLKRKQAIGAANAALVFSRATMLVAVAANNVLNGVRAPSTPYLSRSERAITVHEKLLTVCKPIRFCFPVVPNKNWRDIVRINGTGPFIADQSVYVTTYHLKLKINQ